MAGAGDDQPNYYLHDRLGSVRMVLDRDAVVQAAYTYDAFGNVLDLNEADGYDNPYRFANYGWDAAAGMYYCNARWYEPSLAVFTARDPVRGRFQEPRTLHAYLYCLNEPVNRVDPSGRNAFLLGGSLSFNAGDAARGAGAAMNAVNSMFGGVFGKALAVAMGLTARNAYTALAAEQLGKFTGGTMGVGAVFGWSREAGTFGGFIGWGAGGVGKGMALSLTGDIGFSPNATKLSDLNNRARF